MLQQCRNQLTQIFKTILPQLNYLPIWKLILHNVTYISYKQKNKQKPYLGWSKDEIFVFPNVL